MSLNKTRPLRLMKDALLALSPGDKSCGWHVDDKFFWPCYDNTDITAIDEGVNVWITFTPLLAKQGGGLAVAPTSSRAIWREECRKFIGTFDPKNSAGNTCELATRSPKCNRLLESMKFLHNMEPGDHYSLVAIYFTEVSIKATQNYATRLDTCPPMPKYLIIKWNHPSKINVL